MIRRLLVTTLMAAGTAAAAPGPHGPPGPPPPITPSPEALASVPGLEASKQVEVRKILIERREAHDALRAKEDAERETARARYRAEHEHIDDESSARLRKLLGEDGYRALAAWLVPPRGPGLRSGGLDYPRSLRPHEPPHGMDDPPAVEPPPSGPNGADPQAPER